MTRTDADAPIGATQLDERERKYEVDKAFAFPDLTAALSAGQRVEVRPPAVLEAMYFDTQDHTLLEAGTTLRRRFGGTDPGWHVKGPTSDPITRREIQLPFTGSDAVPQQILDLLGDRFGPIALHPVLFIRTSRTVRSVLSGEELIAELAGDVVVTVDLDTLYLSTWHEVEIEEQLGSTATVERITQSLLQSGARPASYRSKPARALHSGQDSRVPSALEAVMLRIRTQVAALVMREADVREHRAESIHQLRVACRRLRSCLRTFRPAFAKAPTSDLLAELKWLGAALGTARDAEVIASRVAKDVALVAPENLLGPVASDLHGRGAAEIAAAGATLLDVLDSDRYRSLLESLVVFTSAPPISGARRGRRWPRQRLARVIEKTDAVVTHAFAVRSSEQDEALHEARKSAKHVRYAAETLLPIDKRLARTAEAYESIQEVLGEHHDAVVTRSLFRNEGARAGVRLGENGFTYGVLFAIEDTRADEALKKFEKEWKRLAHGARRG